MLTRSLFLAAGWFVLSFIGLLLFGLRMKRRNYLVSVAWLGFVLLAGDAWAYFTFGIPKEISLMTEIMLAVGLVFIILLRNWNAFGQVLWTTTLVVTVLFIAYSFTVTAFTPLNPLSFLLAILFFFLEAAALLLALSHAFESLDSTTRVVWKRRIPQLSPLPGYSPKVSLHVPTHNEPTDVVRQSLLSLARLDYPNFEVLVVDNNTTDAANWKALEAITRQLGPRFRYLHLEQWPGFKSGALNFALAETAPDAEIVATIDSDYQLDPAFLKDLVPAFADPQMAFVQTPQDYRDTALNAYTRATYYGYKYFFDVSMPSRNEHNAIIFAGTMGLIRKSVLQEIGGWDEWCITEDAEASLRILKRGYQSLFINKTYGKGLMPFTFDGLKKQRFRWCFGGIQILKKHWEALMPWAHWVDPQNHLTPAQRYYYLVGGLQWYTDLFNLMFALFLSLGALFSVYQTHFVIRPLTGPLMIMPAIFLFMHLWRFLWVLRQKLHLSWKLALQTMYNFFSMGWAVTLASIQGAIQPKGVFLRTPKSKTQSRLLRALQSTEWETAIGLAALTAGIAAFVHHPSIQTGFLSGLLVWQSSLYLAAPVFSLDSVAMPETSPVLVPAGRSVKESRAAGAALALALALLVIGAVAQFAPSPSRLPNYSQLQPLDIPLARLLGLQSIPVEQRDESPQGLPNTGGAKPTLAPGPQKAPGGGNGNPHGTPPGLKKKSGG